MNNFFNMVTKNLKKFDDFYNLYSSNKFWLLIHIYYNDINESLKTRVV